MLNYSETKNPNAIEHILCVPMEKAKKHEMDIELSELFITLITKQAINPSSVEEKDKPPLYSSIERRLKHCFTFVIPDARLILFLAGLTRTPGSAVMYLWYMQYWCFKKQVKSVDLDLFSKQIFPDGFISDTDLLEIWRSQKVRDDKRYERNLVDYASAGSSLQFSLQGTE